MTARELHHERVARARRRACSPRRPRRSPRRRQRRAAAHVVEVDDVVERAGVRRAHGLRPCLRRGRVEPHRHHRSQLGHRRACVRRPRWRSPRTPRSGRRSRRRKPAPVSSRTDARADAPKVAVSPTSASPMTSADAVIAVRRGSRIALARASEPVIPNIRNSGRPTNRASGRATVASRITAPTSTANAPSATTCAWSTSPCV